MVRKWWFLAALLIVTSAANGCFFRDRPGLFGRYRGQAPQCQQPCSTPCPPNPCDCMGMPGGMMPGSAPIMLTQPPGVMEGLPPAAPPLNTAPPIPGATPDNAKPLPAGPSNSPMKSVRNGNAI